MKIKVKTLITMIVLTAISSVLFYKAYNKYIKYSNDPFYNKGGNDFIINKIENDIVFFHQSSSSYLSYGFSFDKVYGNTILKKIKIYDQIIKEKYTYTIKVLRNGKLIGHFRCKICD